MSSTVVSRDTGLLAWYDALTTDPPGHRIEVVEGVLVVTPSPGGTHQKRARSLAEIIDLAVQAAGLDAVEDFEWRLEHPVAGLGSRVRPDVSVLDPTDPHGVRPVTVEVVSASDGERLVPGQPETRIEGKRRVYAYGGTSVHVEVDTLGDIPTVTWYARNNAGGLTQAATASGADRLDVGGPFPFSLVPAELDDWLRRHLSELARQREELQRRAERAEDTLRRLRGSAPDG